MFTCSHYQFFEHYLTGRGHYGFLCLYIFSTLSIEAFKTLQSWEKLDKCWIPSWIKLSSNKWPDEMGLSDNALTYEIWERIHGYLHCHVNKSNIGYTCLEQQEDVMVIWKLFPLHANATKEKQNISIFSIFPLYYISAARMKLLLLKNLKVNQPVYKASRTYRFCWQEAIKLVRKTWLSALNH